MELVKNDFIEFKTIDAAKSFGLNYYGDWLKEFQVGNKIRYSTNHYIKNYKDKQSLFKSKYGKTYKKFIKDYSVYEAFISYCGGLKGPTLNQYLRFGEGNLSKKNKCLIKMGHIMKNEIDNHRIKKNIICYRTLNYNDLLKTTKKRKIKKGDIIIDKGFMGVGLIKDSLIKSYPNYDTILKIYIPIGANGVYLGLISGIDDEQEILFKPNIKLLILSKKRDLFEKKILIKCLIKIN